MATFNQLLTSYNAATRCPGPFPDQCAIKLGQALEGAGVSTASFKGVRCWGDPKGNHIIRAEQLAEWIGGHVFAGRGTTRSLDPKNFQAEIAGKTGIIFFKDYWQRGAETHANRSGDHIDLWNKNALGGEWTRWSRGVEEFFGIVSDLNDSRSIKFWEVR